jgi:ribosome-binding ATPase YchF (GTP1/OBG family)
MYLSIIGSPGCGKTTLFRAFTGKGDRQGSGASGLAVIEVPDQRLDRLSQLFNPRKTVYSRIEVCDMPSIQEGDMKNEALPQRQIQEMRLSDAFILVLRSFDQGGSAGGFADFHTMLSEFIISDMVQIENRLGRIRKQAGKKESAAVEQEGIALQRCLAHLEEGLPLSSLHLSEGEEKNLRGFQFLSRKPLMVVINCSACARLEAELAAMDEEDRTAFMGEYGITHSLRGRLISLAYRTLGLISFLTVGEDECRAWPVRKGVSAQEAAAAIHTDLSEKFIRAETVAYDDFIRYGDMTACKKNGVWRLEGKQYIVQDGDIISIRAGS